MTGFLARNCPTGFPTPDSVLGRFSQLPYPSTARLVPRVQQPSLHWLNDLVDVGWLFSGCGRVVVCPCDCIVDLSVGCRAWLSARRLEVGLIKSFGHLSSRDTRQSWHCP